MLDRPAPRPPTFADAAWLAGRWQQAEATACVYQEHWSAPAGGAMMGMFRMLLEGKPVVYEFLLLEESADGVWLRLRHYRPEMTELDQGPTRLKLTQAGPANLVFENPDHDKPKRIVYALEGARLRARVVTVRG